MENTIELFQQESDYVQPSSPPPPPPPQQQPKRACKSTRKSESQHPKCQVCDEVFNKTSRAPVDCVCGFTTCRACAKQYFASKVEDVHCMSCRVKWNRNFMMENFEKSYMSTEYRDYRENILFEKEKGLLPMTQPFVEKEIQVELLEEEYKLLQRQQYDLNMKLMRKRQQINKIQMNNEVERRKYIRKCPQNGCQGFLSPNLKCEICNSWVCSECREIKGQTRDVEHTCNPEILESVKLLATDTKPCPKCSALIYKIEGCSQMFCTECHTAFDWNTLRLATGVIHNPHYFEWRRLQNSNNAPIERNPNDVLCGRELDNDFYQNIHAHFIGVYNKYTKYTNALFKDMVSSRMQSAFPTAVHYNNIMNHINSSRELTIKEKYHNHFDYSTTLVCCIDNYINRVPQIKNAVGKTLFADLEIVRYEKKMVFLEKMVRNIIHIREIELPRWIIRDPNQSNLDLRILYMRNKLSDNRFKALIQQRDKETQKNIELTNVLRMFVSCITDLLYRIQDKAATLRAKDNNDDTAEAADPESNPFETFLEEIFGTECEEPNTTNVNSSVSQKDYILKECHTLRDYTNQCMLTVLKTYRSTMTPSINEKFEFVR
jgi:uncharacterized Zn ribbon protein